MDAYQICIYSDQPAAWSAQNDNGSFDVCFYGEPLPPPPCYTSPCSRCHPVSAAASAMHTLFSLSSTETPPSASSDFGDSKYGDDTDMRASLRELERDHPEITTMPAHERPSRDAAPPLVDGYRRRQVAPMPVRLSKSERRLLGHLTRSFDAEDPWFVKKNTWLKVAHSQRLSGALVPLPAQMALLAEHLMFVYPAGLLAFYTDAQAVHHYRTGNETTPTTASSALSLARTKLGFCCLIFSQQRVWGS